MNKLEYIKDISTGIETISYENVNISYPEHTHIGHLHIRGAFFVTWSVPLSRSGSLCDKRNVPENAPKGTSPRMLPRTL